MKADSRKAVKWQAEEMLQWMRKENSNPTYEEYLVSGSYFIAAVVLLFSCFFLGEIAYLLKIHLFSIFFLPPRVLNSALQIHKT